MMLVISGGILLIAGLVGAGFYLGFNTGVHEGYESGYRDGVLGYPRKKRII